jgi:hypothetical protein
MLTCGVASAEYTYAVSPAAIDNINGWVEMEGVYSQTVSGANGFSSMDTDTFGDGLWASLKVKAAYCPSYCMAKLDRYVGVYNGNRLRVEIRLGKWAENQTIELRVREVNSAGGSIREIMKGYFGANTGQHWALNETVILAVALEGNEFIFYTDNYDQIAKVQLLGPITPFQTSQPWRVNIWTETANDSMTAEASGFLAVNVSE